MNDEYRVFISSTSDLVEERAEAIRAVLASNCVPVSMENWAATSDRPTERIIDKLAACDFFVLLAGFRYGEMVEETGTSYVDLEYRQALGLGLRIVVLLKDGTGAAIDDAQVTFRAELSRSHTTQLWRAAHDVARLVMGSLFEIIVYRESATVFRTNANLVDAVGRYLQRTRKRSGERVAYVVQYTGVNALELVRRLLWAGISTHVYVIAPCSQHVISDYQRRRLQENLAQLRNHLDPIDKQIDIDQLLHLYQYDAPGALRALLIDRLLPDNKTEHDLVAVAPYVYMKKQPEDEVVLDIRGGELPGFLLRPTHAGFSDIAQMVAQTINNWHQHEIATPLPIRQQKAVSQRA